MKIIDLLVKISNKEEVPYKLRCLNEIWYYDKANGNYKNADNEKGETLIGANMWEFYYKLEKLRNAVNYLLKKEDE